MCVFKEAFFIFMFMFNLIEEGMWFELLRLYKNVWLNVLYCFYIYLWPPATV